MHEVSDEIIIQTEKVQQSATELDEYSSESMTLILTLVGIVRLVSKDKHFVSHMLKSLLFREDYFIKKGTAVLSVQAEFTKT